MRFKFAAIVAVPVLLWAVLAWPYGAQKLIVQAMPSNTTTVIYTAPTAVAGQQEQSVLITGIWITNIDSVQHSFRLSLAAACAADAVSQYLYYGLPVAPGSVLIQSVEIPLTPTDCIRVWADADQKLNFNLFGATTP